MGWTAEERSGEHPILSSCDDGWYFLRRDVPLYGKQYRAGTLVELQHGEWFVHESAGNGKDSARRLIPIDSSLVCRTSYGGVSLYEIWRGGEGLVYARPVLSDASPQSVDPMAVNVNLPSGQSRVCVRFGRCFLPLEFFNW